MYSEKDFDVMVNIFRAQVCGLKALFLFGSYAHGTANEESDADLVAIVENDFERQEKLRLLTILWNELAHNGYTTDIVIKNSYLYEIDKEIPGTLSYTINREGKVLWKSGV